VKQELLLTINANLNIDLKILVQVGLVLT